MIVKQHNDKKLDAVGFYKDGKSAVEAYTFIGGVLRLVWTAFTSLSAWFRSEPWLRNDPW